MPTGNLKLTSLDKKILHSYCQTLDGLSNYLGNGYEIVLHSLEDYEHSAIKVINGYHTGRTEGAPITDLALKMLEQIRRNEENDHGVIYFSTNVKGEPLKSTTIPVKGEKDRIIGLLCINFYMNTTMADFFCNFAVPLPDVLLCGLLPQSDHNLPQAQPHESLRESAALSHKKRSMYW